MEKKLCIVTCNSLAPEISNLIQSGDYRDVKIKSFPAECMGCSLNNNRIREIIGDDIENYAKILFIVSNCRSVEEDDLPVGRKIEFIRLEQCLEILFNLPSIYHFIKQGYYLISNGWLRNYEKHVREWGFDKATAHTFFNESMKKILLLETGLPGDYRDNLEALSEYIGLPYEIFPVGDVHLKSFLNSLVFSWRHEQEKEQLNERISDITREAADYSLMFHQLKELIDLTSEEKIVKEVASLIDLLFVPEQILYQKFIDGKKISESFFKPPYIQPEFTEEDSIGIELKHQDKQLGYFLITKVRFPKFLTQYSLLGQVIAQFSTLAIENARKYSELIKTKENILISEQHFRTIFEQAPLGIALINSYSGQITDVNSKFADIIGRKPEEICSIEWMSITHPDDLQENLDKLVLLNMGRLTGFHIDNRFCKPDGQIVWTSMTIAPLNVADKTKPLHLCMIEDITNQKKIENQLRESEEKFRMFAESAPVGVIIFNTEGKTQFVSHKFEEMFGYPAGSIPSIEAWRTLAYPDPNYRESVRMNWKVSVEQVHANINQPLEYLVTCKNGTVKNIEFRVASAGEMNFVVCTDITSRVKAEHDAKERLKELQAFYRLAEISERKDISLEEIYQEFAEKLPFSWQYSDIAFAFIKIGKKEYKSSKYTPDSPWTLKTPLKIADKIIGSLEVGYCEERPTEDEGPFLKEERMLIDGVAERLGRITERITLEEKIIDNEKLFKAIMLQSPSAIELYDLDGNQIYVNQAYEVLWGFPASHTVNKFNILKSKEVKRTGLIDYVRRAYQGETVQVPEYLFDATGKTEGKGKGRERWLSTKIYPLKDNLGEVLNIIISHEDVTLKRENEQILTANIRQFKNLSDSGTEMLNQQSVLDIYHYLTNTLSQQYPKAIILFATLDDSESSSILISIKGVSEKRINQSIRLTGFNFFEKPFNLQPVHKEIFKSGKFYHFKGGLASFSGPEFPGIAARSIEKLLGIRQIYTIGINKENKLYAMMHFFNRDSKPITDNEYIETFVRQAGIVIERKILEGLLMESEERYRFIAENMSDVIWSINIEKLRFNYISPSIINLTGFTAEEAMKQSITEALDKESAKYVLSELPKRIEELYAGKRESLASSHELLQRCKDGSYIWVEYTTMLKTGKDGKVTDILGISRNIHQRKMAEIEIQEKNKQLVLINAEKDRFFSIIAHDLRSPFASIVNLSELMSNENLVLSIEEFRTFSKSLYKTSSATYNLLENLLEWSMLQRGVTLYKPELLKLDEFFDNCDEVLIELAYKKSINLHIPENSPLTVFADLNMLRTIIRNLVSNSIKFTPKGGSVRVNVTPLNNGGTLFEVKDSGIGMEPEIRDNLFKIDKNVSRPGTNGEPSTGLGLILCKEFIEKHHGTIWAESTVNQGSSFFFTLPKNQVANNG